MRSIVLLAALAACAAPEPIDAVEPGRERVDTSPRQVVAWRDLDLVTCVITTETQHGTSTTTWRGHPDGRPVIVTEDDRETRWAWRHDRTGQNFRGVAWIHHEGYASFAVAVAYGPGWYELYRHRGHVPYTFEWDERGRLVRFQDGGADPYEYAFTWNDADQLTSLEYDFCCAPNDRREAYYWDAEGRLASTMVATGSGSTRITWTEHDDAGRPLRGEGWNTNWEGRETTWEESWTYDGDGNPIAHEHGADGREQRWTWEDGRVVQDGYGTYAWDETGRIIARHTPGTTVDEDETWEWDDDGILRRYTYENDRGSYQVRTYEGECPHVPYERFERELDPTPSPYPQLPDLDWELLWPG